MRGMFKKLGYDSSSFSLDLGSNFDTSNVINMQAMFAKTGYNSTKFSLNLGSNFTINKVTNINYMFDNIGHQTTNLSLDLSTFVFSNVSTYSDAFRGFRTSGKIYVKNSTARSWIINNSGNSNLTTSNVLIKS